MSLIGQQISQIIRMQEITPPTIRAIYTSAKKEGQIVEYDNHCMRFKYACVKSSEYPESREFTPFLLYACSLVDDSYENGGMMIVFEDLVDARFREYAAVHEFGELRADSHDEGTKLEMDIANREGNLEAYIDWIEKNYPQRVDELIEYIVAE